MLTKQDQYVSVIFSLEDWLSLDDFLSQLFRACTSQIPPPFPPVTGSFSFSLTLSGPRLLSQRDKHVSHSLGHLDSLFCHALKGRVPFLTVVKAENHLPLLSCKDHPS